MCIFFDRNTRFAFSPYFCLLEALEDEVDSRNNSFMWEGCIHVFNICTVAEKLCVFTMCLDEFFGYLFYLGNEISCFP